MDKVDILERLNEAYEKEWPVWRREDIAEAIAEIACLRGKLASDRDDLEPAMADHYLAEARSAYSEGNDDINVDADARMSLGSDGIWVQAWVWVPR